MCVGAIQSAARYLWIYTFAGLFGLFVSFGFAAQFDISRLQNLITEGDDKSLLALLWILMVCAEGILWGIGFALWIRWAKKTKHEQSLEGLFNALLVAGVPLILIVTVVSAFAFAVLGGDRWPPNTLASTDISWIKCNVLPFIVAGLSVLAMYSSALVAKDSVGAVDSLGSKVEIYLGLKQEQDRFLGLAGAILAASVLATTLLINAYNAGNPNKPFSEIFVFLHGGFFTVLLGLVFFVSRQPLRNEARSLERELLEMASERNAHEGSLSRFLEHQASVRRLLEVRANSLPALKEGISILAPILGAVIPALLGGSPPS